jgi:hypothetical protein
VAGLLLGLMAGFNYTLAATFGISALFACVVSLLLHRFAEARDLVWLTVSIFIGALPKNLIMFSGFENITRGSPLSGPNLDYPVAIWGDLLSRIFPPTLVPLVCLVVFVTVAYGVRLVGLPAMALGKIAGISHRGVGILFATVFVLSFVIGTFFSFHEIGGAPAQIILLQPTLWILSIFSLRPILSWLERGGHAWRPIALWGMLGLTWSQSLLALNFSHMVAFSTDTVAIFKDIRLAASPDDVIVYLPVGRTDTPILGGPQQFTDYAVMAMTGLDGYFSNETYSVSDALSGVEGQTESEILTAANRIYRQRTHDVELYLRGNVDPAALNRLSSDHVRWIVLSKSAVQETPLPAQPWRQNPEIAVYRLPE